MMRSKSRAAVAVKRPSARTGLLAAIVLAAVAAVLLPVLLAAAPQELSDAEALTMLPAGAEILARHERSGGKVRRLEYRYTEEHVYCLVERTERLAFRCQDGVWSPEGEPEVLGETEDWSALTGTWAEQTGGPGGRSVWMLVSGFEDGVLRGQASCQDGTASWEGPAEEVFGPGRRQTPGGAYILKGTGFFRYCCLRVDRDEGIFFNNDIEPMETPALPAAPPAETGAAEDALLERVTAGEERDWRVVTEASDVYPVPELSAEPLGTAEAGTVLACAGPLPEMGWIQTEYDGVIGYMAEGSAMMLTADSAVSVVTAWADVNVRSGPGQEYDWLDTVRAGTRLVSTAEEDGWYLVIDGDLRGYVAGDYVIPEPVTVPED